MVVFDVVGLECVECELSICYLVVYVGVCVGVGVVVFDCGVVGWFVVVVGSFVVEEFGEVDV